MASLPMTTIGSLHRFDKDLHASIDKAIGFQRECGLDIVSDGEQRADMISYFAESFEGLGFEKDIPVVLGKIKLKGSPTEFSKVQDLAHIRSKYPDLKVKIAITGPTTLGMTCASKSIKTHYKSIADFSLYEDIAIALKPIAKALADKGAMVQIDEPFLSQGYKDISARVRLLDYITDGLPRDSVTVHVCGFIGKFGVIEDLLKLGNVSVLSFAFAGRVERTNVEHLSFRAFEDHDKKLGAGCIAVTPVSEEEVDSPEAVYNKLMELAGKVGRENMAFAHPDCGMRATEKSLIPHILKNMRAGVARFG